MSESYTSHSPLLKKSVTAVVTAFNASRYISRCVDSIINQKDEFCDIVVINDGSTDQTKEVLANYGDRIKYIEFSENQGPAVGRTLGLKETKTEFVAFIDADDYWESDFAHKMISFLLSNRTAVAACCGYKKNDYNRKQYLRPKLSQTDKEYYEEGNICPNFYEFWDTYCSILTGTVLMRTEIAKKTGGQRKDLRLTQDLEFWGYLATFGDWAFLPEHLFITDEQILRPKERLRKFKRRFSFFKELDIDSWSKRIVPRLEDTRSITAFNSFSSNIITTIAFAKAYLLNARDSYIFSLNNRNSLLNSGWGKGLRVGLKLGPLLWPFVCLGFRAREIMKAYLFPLRRLL